jgi:hypothetical protein
MKTAITLFIILSFSQIQAQTWLAKETFQGDSRIVPTSFTISSKGYVGLGLESNSPNNPLNDMWEYDPALDRWFQAENFIGDARWGAFSFVIDGKGYVGGGSLSSPGATSFSGTFYQYDPVANSWNQKENLPASRAFSTGFNINGKGYVVFGYANGTRDETVIMYDPSIQGNPWTELADIPNVVDQAFAVEQPAVPLIIGNTAYLVGGIHTSEVWKFNPANDTWISKNDVVISPTASFTVAGEGYIVGERNQSLAQGGSGVDLEDVIMKYDEGSDQWTQVVELPSSMNAELFENFALTPCDLKVMVGNHFEGDLFEFKPKRTYTSGATLLCNNSQATYTLSNIPPEHSITWTKSSNLIIMSGQGTNSLTVKGMSFGNYGSQGWIKATLNGPCGIITIDPYDIWVDKPSGAITNPSGVPAIVASLSSYVTINVTDVPGTFGSYNLNWWTNDPTSLDLAPGGNVCVVECLKAGYNYVYVTGTNSCGEGIYHQIPIDVTSGGGGGGICCPHPQIVINPNPTADWVNITFSNKEELEEYYEDSDMVYHVVITDMTGHSKYRGTLNKNGLKVNLKQAKEGIYLVKVYNKDGESTSRLIID